jgi:hypothetical protein
MDAARRADSVYRWRGDGLARDGSSIDYLHGHAVGAWRAAGCEAGEGEAQRLTVDSRLMHWDLSDDADVHARTA